MSVDLDFADIYQDHHRKVLNLCSYLLNSGHAAEDAAHEVFLRVQRKIDTYNPDYSLSNWILKIASNYCMDLLRKRGREQKLFVADSSDSPNLSSARPTPLGEILSNEKGKNVRRALESLDEKLRIPLILFFYNDLRYDEIAATLNVPRNTVATLIFRGKQELRKKLKKEKYHAMP
ncbi:MAG: sigma-70 family RNA polymerase sigma factor [Acidobacteriota bacterium]